MLGRKWGPPPRAERCFVGMEWLEDAKRMAYFHIVWRVASFDDGEGIVYKYYLRYSAIPEVVLTGDWKSNGCDWEWKSSTHDLDRRLAALPPVKPRLWRRR
jgi:hypothetical protein